MKHITSGQSMVASLSARHGFTIVELLIVVVVIAILAAITIVAFSGVREKATLSAASVNLSNVAKAMATYQALNGELPADSSVGIPGEIAELMGRGTSDIVDTGLWEGSYFDYEVWDLDYDSVMDTYQISIRFCRDEDGHPKGEDGVNCNFPKEPWAEDFVPESSVYYCLEGYCRSHKWVGGIHTPGYCINCPNNQAIAKPGES